MSFPRPTVFTDLDETLFQTARKMSEPPCRNRFAARASNGHHSYMTESQSGMVAWLNETTRLIPVTARSTSALSRCAIPFRDHRIAANGAVILRPDGSPDPDWRARIVEISLANQDALDGLMRYTVGNNANGALRCWNVEEFGHPIYFCVKSNTTEDALDAVMPGISSLAGEAFARHRNGNNLSFTPIAISKRAAVAHLIDRIDPSGVILGFGDSLTDLPFMQLCHAMMIPTRSQIHAHMKVEA